MTHHYHVNHDDDDDDDDDDDLFAEKYTVNITQPLKKKIYSIYDYIIPPFYALYFL
jgi:hypothetical protein